MGGSVSLCEGRSVTPEAVCYHEAGHVVWYALNLGRSPHAVSVVPIKESLGRMTPAPGAKSGKTEPTKDCSKALAESLASFRLSGLAAESVLRRSRALWSGAEFDEAREQLECA